MSASSKRRKRRKRRVAQNGRNKQHNAKPVFDKLLIPTTAVDVMTNDKSWFKGIIQNTNESEVEIQITIPRNISKYILCDKQYPASIYRFHNVLKSITLDKNIHSTATRIRPLHSKTIQVIKCDSKSPAFSAIRLLHYQSPVDQKNYIIIATGNRTPAAKNSNNWIYFYDISLDKFIRKFKYPQELQDYSLDFDVALRKQNNCLYFVDSSFAVKNCIHILNLGTAKWSKWIIYRGGFITNCITNWTKVHINCVKITNQYLVILSDNVIIKCNLDSGQIDEFGDTTSDETMYGKLAHIGNGYDKWFAFIFGKASVPKSEFYDESFNKDKIANKFALPIKKLRWNSFMNSLSEKREDVTHIFYAFNHMIFIVNLYCHAVVIFDFITNKWYYAKTEFVFPDTPKSLHCISVNVGNQVHLFGYNHREHFKFSLINLIPEKLYIVYGKYYTKVIKGFIRQVEFTFHVIVSDDIQRLILQSFPMFVE